MNISGRYSSNPSGQALRQALMFTHTIARETGLLPVMFKPACFTAATV